MVAHMRTPEELFTGSPTASAIFQAVTETIDSFGQYEVRVTKSQIAFRRRRGLAYLWRPDRYLNSDVPAVLSIALPRQLNRSRFKEMNHPAPKMWMHHMELWQPGQLDDEIRQWLQEAYESAA